MPVILTVSSGPGTGQTIEIPEGQSTHIGRNNRAEHAFTEDQFMSGVHLLIKCEEQGCVVQDLDSSNGTYVNGMRIREVSVKSGDHILAGETYFRVAISTSPEESAPALLPITKPQVLEMINTEAEAVYALLDAAQDKVLEFVKACKGKCESLYRGDQGKSLAEVAPYLLAITKHSEESKKLVEEGWGKNWGVYFACPELFSAVHHHLRHFLMAKTEDGKEMYFRFYDPRVMRVYIPSCLEEERREFFGPITKFWMEGEKPTEMVTFQA